MSKSKRARSRAGSEKEHSLFISWSDGRGRAVAEIFKDWLSLVLPTRVQPLISTKNIQAGDGYFNSLTCSINSSIACFICVTKLTPQSTWVAFEAGLAYATNNLVLCPILFEDVKTADLGPLNNLQMCHFSRDEVLECILQTFRKRHLKPDGLAERFNQNWQELDTRIREALLKPLFPQHDLFLSPVIEDRSRDLVDSNQILQAAKKLNMLALTYVTLSQNIADMTFNNLTEVVIRTYALPCQQNTHPTYVNNYTALSTEWITSISTILKAFCDKRRCPQLKKLQFVILSASPDFTGTYAEWQKAEKQGRRLRLTLCVSGFQMSNIPTFIIDFDANQNLDSSSSFLQLFNSTGLQPSPPLTFNISPETKEEYINAFVKRAAKVTNHPGQPAQRDIEFSFSFRPSNATRTHSAKQVEPIDISRIIKLPLTSNSRQAVKDWQIDIDKKSYALTLFSMQSKAGSVEARHFFANFLILLEPSGKSFNIVLVNKPKPPWELDVPGGKFASTDTTAIDNVCREAFEELGWILEPKRVKGPIGVNYDHRALHESGKPGLIQYFYYIISPPVDWQTDACRPNYSTTNKKLFYRDFSDLVSEKRTLSCLNPGIEHICHIPLRVLIALADELSIQLKGETLDQSLV